LSFEFFDTTCGILNRTTEQKIHRLVLPVALRTNLTTNRKLQSHTVSVAITTFILGNGKKTLDTERIHSTVCIDKL
jgi:hypothetical protein